MGLTDERKRIPSNVLACFKLCCYTLTWKTKKIACTNFVNVNIALYSFKRIFLQRKLQFYTKFHKKDVSFIAL